MFVLKANSGLVSAQDTCCYCSRNVVGIDQRHFYQAGTMDRSSRNRLTHRLLPLFAGDTLFNAIARAVCRAGCLPRKELYEAWEVARRVHRRFRGGRVVDLACGHGLLAQILLLMDPCVPVALAVDRRIPENAARLAAELQAEWPGLAGRFAFLEGDLAEVPLRSRRSDPNRPVRACLPALPPPASGARPGRRGI